MVAHQPVPRFLCHARDASTDFGRQTWIARCAHSIYFCLVRAGCPACRTRVVSSLECFLRQDLSQRTSLPFLLKITANTRLPVFLQWFRVLFPQCFPSQNSYSSVSCITSVRVRPDPPSLTNPEQGGHKVSKTHKRDALFLTVRP